MMSGKKRGNEGKWKKLEEKQKNDQKKWKNPGKMKNTKN